MKRKFTCTIALVIFCQLLILKAYSQTTQPAAGVQKVTVGAIDKFTPYSFCNEQPMSAGLNELPAGKLPFNIGDIKININNRGVVVEIPLDDAEQLYGFGMQIGSFNQRGLKKRPIVNDNPLNDLGYTHGPTTFYVSNKGYGILINTSRYTTFYCGSTEKIIKARQRQKKATEEILLKNYIKTTTKPRAM